MERASDIFIIVASEDAATHKAVGVFFYEQCSVQTTIMLIENLSAFHVREGERGITESTEGTYEIHIGLISTGADL